MNVKYLFSSIILLVGLLCWGNPVTAQTSIAQVTVSRSGPLFTPPTANCGGVYADGRQTPYTTLSFTVSSNVEYDFRFAAAGGIPTYVALYSGFSPSNPLGGCIAQNVRTGPGTNRVIANLQTGTTYTFVIGFPLDVSDWTGTATEYPVFFSEYFTDPLGSGVVSLVGGAPAPPPGVPPPPSSNNDPSSGDGDPPPPPQPIQDGRITNVGENVVVIYPGQDEEGNPALDIYCIGADGQGNFIGRITQADVDPSEA